MWLIRYNLINLTWIIEVGRCVLMLFAYEINNLCCLEHAIFSFAGNEVFIVSVGISSVVCHCHLW